MCYGHCVCPSFGHKPVSVVTKQKTTGSRCTRRRQLLAVQRTGLTAIRRHTAGGVWPNRTRPSDAFAIRLPASKIDSAGDSTGSRAKCSPVRMKFACHEYCR